MLPLYDLKFHCRTCLVKIENNSFKEDSKKLVSLAKYPEIGQFMRRCLSNNCTETTAIDHQLDLYVPHMCCICLAKWQDFATHYLLAVESDKMLRNILESEDRQPNEVTDECEERNKLFLRSENSDMLDEIEIYETVSPFFPTSRPNTPSNDSRIGEPISNSSCSEINDEDEMDAILQPAKTDETDLEDLFISDAEEFQPKTVKNKKQNVQRTTKKSSCRSKGKSKGHAPNTIKMDNNHLNDSKENASKKVAYRCEPCKKFFYGSITYEGHIKRVHEGIKKAYQCKECDKAYSFPHNLAEHIAASHRQLAQDESQQTLQCEHCNKPYKNKASLTQHLRNHHQDCSAESKRVICDQCGFLAAHQMSLTQHIKNKHTEVQEIKCEQCSKAFKSQYYLKYHMLSFHNPMNIKPFKCPQCPMAFTRRPRLNIHIRTHLNYSERIKCDFEGCDVRFVKLSAKRRHMRLVHLKVKQHVCDICGEGFGIKATLRHHRYIHTGEKPYKCNVCGQAFRQLTAMKTHRKMHANKNVDATTTTTSTESDILSNITQIDRGFEDSSNDFV